MHSDYKKLYAVYITREVFFYTFNPGEKYSRHIGMYEMADKKYLTPGFAQDDMQEILEWLTCN